MSSEETPTVRIGVPLEGRDKEIQAMNACLRVLDQCLPLDVDDMDEMMDNTDARRRVAQWLLARTSAEPCR